MTRSTASLDLYDFRQPRQLTPMSWRTLQRWYAEGCELVSERWRKLGLDVSLGHSRTRVLSLRSALELIPEPGWGGRGKLGATSIDTLLSCPPQRLQSLVKMMLGDTTAIPGTDGSGANLTAFEESIAELLFSDFLKGFGDAWPGAEPLSCRYIESISQPQRTRMFPPRTTLVATVLTIGRAAADAEAAEEPAQGQRGDSDIIWLIPQVDIEDLIEVECSVPELPRSTPHPAISQIMREVPISVTVELGRTDLSMSELTSLQLGDVVVLEQSVNRPLSVRVGNAYKFRGRPGRIGARRCLEIEQVLEDVAPEAISAALPH